MDHQADHGVRGTARTTPAPVAVRKNVTAARSKPARARFRTLSAENLDPGVNHEIVFKHRTKHQRPSCRVYARIVGSSICHSEHNCR